MKRLRKRDKDRIFWIVVGIACSILVAIVLVDVIPEVVRLLIYAISDDTAPVRTQVNHLNETGQAIKDIFGK